MSDDVTSITLTTDGTSRTITGSGTIEASTIAQTPVTSVTGMTGELGTGASLSSAVTGSPAINLINATFPSGSVIQTVSNRPSNYSSTTAYNSASLVPCAQQTITAKKANSTFLIHWNGEYGRSTSGRSQWAIGTTYTAGQSSYSSGYFFYSHYGHYTNSDQRLMTSYSYHDKSQTLAAGASVTYYIWLGVVGSATDTAEHQEIQVQEIAA